MNWTLLQNSLLVSILSTLAAVLAGFFAALALRGFSVRLRQWSLAGAVLALALPPFLATNCWMHFLGYTGTWREWLPVNIYSLGGTVWILTLLTWPITLFLVLGAWQRLEPGQLESDVALQGGPLVRALLFPLSRPALGLAGVLSFVLVLNNFAVPALLQTKVFPAELWVSFNTTFDYAKAVRTGWPLFIAPLLLLLWIARRGASWPGLEGPVSSKLFRQQLGKLWFGFSVAWTILLLALAVGLPLTQLLLSQRTWAELFPAVAAGKLALWNSFLFAAATASVSVALSLVTWRWRIGLALWLPFLLPGVLLGIALIFLLNRPGLAFFYQSVGIVIFGFTIRFWALSWTGARNAMSSVDPDLTAAAKLFGASKWRLLKDVYGPQIGPQLAAVWYVTYLFCLWDVETLVLIVPPAGETLALRIFNLLHYGHNSQVNALCLVLLALAVAPMLVWSAGQRLVNSFPINLPRASLALLPFLNQFRMGDRQACRLGCLTLLGMVFMSQSGCQQSQPNQTPIKSQLFERVQVIGSRGTGLGQFNKPRSVAVDASDNLYVVDMTGRVQKFSSNGVFLSSWQMPETDKGRPKGMCRDANGNVVVIEPHYSRVNHFSADGKLVTQWGTHGTNAGQLAFPRSAIVNSHGDIYVSEFAIVDRVQKFTANGGKLLCAFGHIGSSPGEFNRPEGLGIDRADRLYVADSCNHRIQIFSADGEFLRSYGRAGHGPGELSYPYDVQIDRAGLQFVCEFGNSRIQIFDEHDKPVEILGSIGGAPGQFSNPWGIAFDSNGNLYVADSQNHRVQKFIRHKHKRALTSVSDARNTAAKEAL